MYAGNKKAECMPGTVNSAYLVCCDKPYSYHNTRVRSMYVRIARTCDDEFRRNRRPQRTSGSASSAVSRYSALYSSSSSPIVLHLGLGSTQATANYGRTSAGSRLVVVLSWGYWISWGGTKPDVGRRTGTRKAVSVFSLGENCAAFL